QVDQPGYAVRIARCNGRQLLPSDGVPDEHGTLEMQCVKYLDDIVPKPIDIVGIIPQGLQHVGIRWDDGIRWDGHRRRTGGAEAASSDPVDVVGGYEFRRKLTEEMCREAAARQHHNWTPSATPIENLQLDVLINCYELCPVRRLLPLCLGRTA